jgi:SNF family Na+-dependent transporter
MAVVVIKTLNLVVKQCVIINQTYGLWFFLDVLQATLTSSVNLQANVDRKVVVDLLL